MLYYWIIDHQCWRNIIWLTWIIIVKRLPIPFPDFSLLPQVMTGNPVPPNSQLLAAPMEVGTMLSLDHLHLFSHLKGWCTLNVYNVYKYQHCGHFVKSIFWMGNADTSWYESYEHDMSPLKTSISSSSISPLCGRDGHRSNCSLRNSPRSRVAAFERPSAQSLGKFERASAEFWREIHWNLLPWWFSLHILFLFISLMGIPMTLTNLDDAQYIV